MERRLAAILAADVVNYSKLMGADQEGTLAALRQFRAELFGPVVDVENGNIVKSMGDGWIVEFPSISDAVNCAIKIQYGLTQHNIIQLRIGVHTGEVVFEDTDVFGDGVNIAARLEALAAPGQILISDTAHQSLDAKSAKPFSNCGKHELKNIERQVDIWYWPQNSKAPVRAVETANGQLPALPDKPSIAVLPFDNMSNDPDQEYFADGMTEDLITNISKLSGLLVIGRNSSFVYKGKAVDLQQIGRELGVHYLLEGSVRRAGSRVRINAQLIDAQSGHHLWAERHDGTLDDIFDLQDEITGKIVSALSLQLTENEKSRLGGKYTDNHEAHDWFLRARIHYRKPGPQANAEAREMFDQAMALDPGFSLALAIRSYLKFHAWFFGWNTAPDALSEAFADAERAVALDPDLAIAHSYLGWMHMWGDGHDRALAEHETALALDSNSSEGYIWYASTLIYSGQPELAVEPMQQATRLDPHFPPNFLVNYGHMYLQMGRYVEAKEHLQVVIDKTPDFPITYFFLAAAHAATEDREGAQNAAAEILKRMPGVTIASFSRQVPYAKAEHLARIVDGLRMAGLPE